MKSPQNSDLPPIKLYDLQLIHKICLANEEKVAKMVEVFIDQVSQSIQKIMAAYYEKDFLRIKDLINKTKQTITYFGAITLEKELIYIEDLLIKEPELSELKLKILNLDKLIKEVVDKMKNDFYIINY